MCIYAWIYRDKRSWVLREGMDGSSVTFIINIEWNMEIYHIQLHNAYMNMKWLLKKTSLSLSLQLAHRACKYTYAYVNLCSGFNKELEHWIPMLSIGAVLDFSGEDWATRPGRGPHTWKQNIGCIYRTLNFANVFNRPLSHHAENSLSGRARK